MAEPKIVRGTYISILVGNDDEVLPGSETFTTLCGVTTRSLTHQANTSDSFVRDCADPEAVPVRRLIVTGEQWDLAASGQLNRAQRPLLDAIMSIPRNYRFVLGEPADDEVADFPGYYKGPGILTQKTINGDDGEWMGIDLTIGSDGAWVWVDAA